MLTRRPSRRALLAAACSTLALTALPATASAALPLGPCPAPSAKGEKAAALPDGTACGTLRVPLDHSGATPGTVDLALARVPAAGPSKGTLVVLTGGPGEPAVPLAAELSKLLGGARESYDLVLLDQRGTGGSDAVKCSSRQTAASVAACAEALGPRRAFWTTSETASDVEDVRAALEVEKLTLYGVSYGAKVAGEYARRFPDRTAGLILDSPAPVDGLDTSLTLRQLGLPRVMREVCFPPSCRRFLADPTSALGKLAARLDRSPLKGRQVLPSGRTKAISLDVDDLYGLVVLSDLDPLLRSELPAAIASGVLGDAAPLIRLATVVNASSEDQDEATAVNSGRLLATSCVEGRLPWAPDSPIEGREEALTQAFASAPAEATAPFDRATVLGASIATACLNWPSTPKPAAVPAQGPAVPVLVLAGRDDLRTPLEDARRTAAQYPGAKVLAVPSVGHSVLASDPSTCSRKGITAFLAGQPVLNCVRTRLQIAPAPFIPASLSELAPARGLTGPAARTATAALATLVDLARQPALSVSGSLPSGTELRSPGLRGGVAVVRGSRVRLTRYEVVRGVRLSGTLTRSAATLTLSAPGGVTGVLTGKGSRFAGTIGGQPVRLRLPQ